MPALPPLLVGPRALLGFCSRYLHVSVNSHFPRCYTLTWIALATFTTTGSLKTWRDIRYIRKIWAEHWTLHRTGDEIAKPLTVCWGVCQKSELEVIFDAIDKLGYENCSSMRKVKRPISPNRRCRSIHNIYNNDNFNIIKFNFGVNHKILW